MELFKIGDIVRIKNAYKFTINTGISSKWFDEFGNEEFIITEHHGPIGAGYRLCIAKTGEVVSFSFNSAWLEYVEDIRLREDIADDFNVFLNNGDIIHE